MDWNFSFASSLGLTSGCHCRADFLYACIPKGGASAGQAGRGRASELASGRGNAARTCHDAGCVQVALTFLMSFSSAFLCTPRRL